MKLKIEKINVPLGLSNFICLKIISKLWFSLFVWALFFNMFSLSGSQHFQQQEQTYVSPT